MADHDYFSDKEAVRADFDQLLALTWGWRQVGDTHVLSTLQGGARVVLAPMISRTGNHEARATIAVRDGTGALRDIRAHHPMARLLATTPDLVRVGLDIMRHDDRPRYLPLLRDALERGGVL